MLLTDIRNQENILYIHCFSGILMGISVRTGSPLALDIAPPMWKLLVGLSLSMDDLTEVDKDYVTG